VSDDENGSYGHPDHIKAHHVTCVRSRSRRTPLPTSPGEPWRGAAPLRAHVLAQPAASPRTRRCSPRPRLAVRGRREPEPFGVDDALVTTRVDVGAHVATKLAAMRAHASQIGDESFFMNVPDDLVGAFLGIEEFILEDGEPLDGAPDCSSRPERGALSVAP
jgi:N-acetyl-1-D-myo-inositol-2-amino-2-deoxy-alpha-D-glucopyranoside deacetylase